VGRPDVQAFAGSLDGAHARKGVMITTGKFSPEARAFVDKIEKRIVLIDGGELVGYMVDNEIGVDRKTTFHIYRIDDDFFEAAE
jgi:restriction system protein